MKKSILVLLSLVLFVGGPSRADSITQLALDTPDLSTLVDAVVKAGLADTLDQAGPFTVFAPTNKAFLDAGIDPALVDEETLRAVLFDHVLPGDFTKRFLRIAAYEGQRLTTAGGLDLGVSRSPFAVNGSSIISGQINADNGTVFLVDTVLLRPAPSIADLAIGAPYLSTLVEAASNAGLVETLSADGPWTVFAPTNSSFEALGIDPSEIDDETLAEVLLDHVVRGTYTKRELFTLARTGGSLRTMGGLELDFRGFLRVNNLRIVAANLSAQNGIVHVINGVLLESSSDDSADDDSSSSSSSDSDSDDRGSRAASWSRSAR